jgi:hypothetical protein
MESPEDSVPFAVSLEAEMEAVALEQGYPEAVDETL